MRCIAQSVWHNADSVNGVLSVPVLANKRTGYIRRIYRSYLLQYFKVPLKTSVNHRCHCIRLPCYHNLLLSFSVIKKAILDF